VVEELQAVRHVLPFVRANVARCTRHGRRRQVRVRSAWGLRFHLQAQPGQAVVRGAQRGVPGSAMSLAG
jgi:hypothetical protein